MESDVDVAVVRASTWLADPVIVVVRCSNSKRKSIRLSPDLRPPAAFPRARTRPHTRCRAVVLVDTVENDAVQFKFKLFGILVYFSFNETFYQTNLFQNIIDIEAKIMTVAFHQSSRSWVFITAWVHNRTLVTRQWYFRYLKSKSFPCVVFICYFCKNFIISIQIYSSLFTMSLFIFLRYSFCSS